MNFTTIGSHNAIRGLIDFQSLISIFIKRRGWNSVQIPSCNSNAEFECLKNRWGASHVYFEGVNEILTVLCALLYKFRYSSVRYHHHHHHVREGLSLIPVPCILKMTLVPPSLPRSSYVSSSFWFICMNLLWRQIWLEKK